jgi:hypothetical protein
MNKIVLKQKDMKQFKPNVVIILLLIILIIPSVALASWWNPFTWQWNFFNWFSRSQTSVVQPKKNTQNSNSSITVTSPNGGETWTIGAPQTIRWTSNNVGNVNIDMINKSTSSYLNRIAANIKNTGSYSWTLPDGQIGLDYPEANDYVIRISSVNLNASDESGNTFSIIMSKKITGCTPNWACDWMPCNGGSQVMGAKDSNNCGLPLLTAHIACPALARACTVSQTCATDTNCPQLGVVCSPTYCPTNKCVSGRCTIVNTVQPSFAACVANTYWKCQTASPGGAAPAPGGVTNYQTVCGCVPICPSNAPFLNVSAGQGTWPDGSLKGEYNCNQNPPA